MSRTTYGGQAVIEGVMMRGMRGMAVAVRDPAGKIVVTSETLTPSGLRARMGHVPLVRGALVMWDALVLGMRTLSYSANVAMGPAEGEPGDAGASAAGASAMPQGVMWGTMAFSLTLAVGLFFVTPVLIMGAIDQYMPSAIASNLVEKVIRLTFILGYMALIALMPDVRRVYAYHGAEHKTIMAFEAGDRLDVASVRPYTRVHPRCGTTFLIVVVLISFVLFSLLGQPPLLERVLSRIVLVPVIAGIAYEFIRFAANHYDRPLVRALLAPGLAVQALTTREPDDSQLEVAIEALKSALAIDRRESEAPAGV